jgi:hypothetical protein
MTCALARLSIAFLTVSLALPIPSSSFESSLSDEAVREAYFLGQRNDTTTAAFFLPYLKTLPPPPSGPYVSEIEIYTPYVQVLERSSRNTVGYSAQQARLDYRHHRNILFVRVRIDFTSTYGALELFRSGRLDKKPDGRSPSPNFDRDFRVGLSQNDQWIKPLSIQIVPAFTLAIGHYPFLPPDDDPSYLAPPQGEGYYAGAGNYCALGWLVWLAFDARDVASDDAQIEVLTTDGQHVVVPFDLYRLR